MTAAERASYAARKRWDAFRDARNDAQHHRSLSATGVAEFRSVEPSTPPLSHEDAAIREMRRIIDDPKALDTSKVAAARALSLLMDEGKGSQSDEVALWLACRDTIALLPTEEKLRWLLGELGEPLPDWLPPEERDDQRDGADVALLDGAA